jgi:hypothetical protein
MKKPAVILLALFCWAGGTTLPVAAESISQPGHRPLMVLGRNHPGRITGQVDEGVVVDLRSGGTQIVQFNEIWRIRRAFASDEPAGTTVIDFANNRLFVATPVAGLVADLGKKIPLGQFTAPNGEIIYMATGKITDISKALPGIHNPSSKTVIGTRDGAQQVAEPSDDAKRIVAEAHVAQ